MIAAFREAFGDRSDVLFVMKIAGADKFPHDHDHLQRAIAGKSNIRMLTEPLGNADIYALIKQSDVVLSLHRSEGLGMVPAEAALLGTPVVATAWSGVLDFLDSSCAGLVGYRLVPVDRLDNLRAPDGSLWAEPHVAEAACWLRRLESDVGLRRHLAARAQEQARALFSQAHFEQQFRLSASVPSLPHEHSGPA